MDFQLNDEQKQILNEAIDIFKEIKPNQIEKFTEITKILIIKLQKVVQN